MLVQRRWQDWPLMTFWTWACVDGSYALHYRGPMVLEMMREVNLPASFWLYCICGLLWLPDASLAAIGRRGIHFLRYGTARSCVSG